jgi:hypothetical protein
VPRRAPSLSASACPIATLLPPADECCEAADGEVAGDGGDPSPPLGLDAGDGDGGLLPGVAHERLGAQGRRDLAPAPRLRAPRARRSDCGSRGGRRRAGGRSIPRRRRPARPAAPPGSAASSVISTWGMVSTSWRTKSSWEPCIRPPSRSRSRPRARHPARRRPSAATGRRRGPRARSKRSLTMPAPRRPDAPSSSPSGTGTITMLPCSRPSTISTCVVPRIPVDDVAASHARPSSTTKTAPFAVTAPTGTKSASGRVAVTTLTSTVMPIISGVSSGKAKRTR